MSQDDLMTHLRINLKAISVNLGPGLWRRDPHMICLGGGLQSLMYLVIVLVAVVGVTVVTR